MNDSGLVKVDDFGGSQMSTVSPNSSNFQSMPECEQGIAPTEWKGMNQATKVRSSYLVFCLDLMFSYVSIPSLDLVLFRLLLLRLLLRLLPVFLLVALVMMMMMRESHATVLTHSARRVGTGVSTAGATVACDRTVYSEAVPRRIGPTVQIRDRPGEVVEFDTKGRKTVEGT